MREVWKKVMILVLKMSIVTILVAFIWERMIKMGWVSNDISQWALAITTGVSSVLFEELRKRSNSKKNDRESI